jgi:hypothetical protein
LKKSDRFEFDVLLSFAGSERDYARAIHDIAIANGLRVFLDEEFQHEIWGKNLIEYLDHTYRERSAYVLVLISAAYNARAFTRVERRAAFDRMIRERSEYLLPVKVEDAWIEGLPTSTAFLDLCIHGVLGVCEFLVRKIRGSFKKLKVPQAITVPRVPSGYIPGDQLATFLLELCARPGVTIFGALIYDEKSVTLRKLFRDHDYWDALDKASGPNFEVFAVRDTESYATEDASTIEFLTAASLNRSRSRGFYFSTLLRDYFGKDKTRLMYPSLLLFVVERREVRYCRLIPFRATSVEDTFGRLSALLSVIASGIEQAGGPTASSSVLWEHLKEKLVGLKYTLYIQQPARDATEAVLKLMTYVEK